VLARFGDLSLLKGYDSHEQLHRGGLPAGDVTVSLAHAGAFLQ
jgi:hypothetical protein